MIVCHCKAINDRTIRKVVRNGAASAREVALACNAGRVCGGCSPLIRELIAGESDDVATSELPVAAAS